MTSEGTKPPVALFLITLLAGALGVFLIGYSVGAGGPRAYRCRCESPGEPVPGYPMARGSATTYDAQTPGSGRLGLIDPACEDGVNYLWDEVAGAWTCECPPGERPVYDRVNGVSRCTPDVGSP